MTTSSSTNPGNLNATARSGGGSLGRVAVLVLLGGLARLAAGCAAGSTIDTGSTGIGGGLGASSGGGEGGSSSTASSSSSSVTATGAGGSGGAGDSCDGACPAGFVDLDGDAMTGDCGCEYACEKKGDVDPVDPAFTDDNCDGSDGVVAECVFVSKKHGAPGGDGTREKPLVSVDAALAFAAKNGKASVCVAGTVDGELHDGIFLLPSGVSLYGGFDADDVDFPFRRTEKVQSILRGEGSVVVATVINAETHVEGLVLRATKTPLFGGSTYGVRLGGGTGMLFVRYNVLDVEEGGDGQAGFNGSAPSPAQADKGADASNGCTGSDCGYGGAQGKCLEYGGKGGDGGYDSNGGTAGSPGTGNAVPGSGGAGSNCFGGGNNGQAGGAATMKGASGESGKPGLAIGTVLMDVYLASDGSDGTTGKNGKGGSGGGGGGGGDDAGIFCKSDK
ncbi:MAG: hypothetical protein FJ096_21270, partial [Deltaproteobacteria bacterium]|nr:hypothetical protein [Deltaproteobacteria bacterium]